MNQAFSKIWIVVILAIFIVGGILAWQYLMVPKEEVKDETANWKIYRNEEYGYEIKYPQDWKIVNVDWITGREYVQFLSPLINNKYYFVLNFGARNKGDNTQISYQPDEDWELLKSLMRLGDKVKIGNVDVLTTEIVEKGKVHSVLYSNRLGAGRIEISGLEIQANSGFIEGPQHLSASDVESIDLKNLPELKLASQILSTFKFIELEKAEEEAPKVEEIPQVEEKPTAPDIPALKAPVLTDPGISVKKHEAFTLNWTSVKGAKRYWLQRDTSTNFSIPAWYCETNSHTDNPGVGTSAPEVTTTYYYRVKACDDRECGPWSNVVDMQVIVPSITVISPNGGEKWIIGKTYDIKWSSTDLDKVTIDLFAYNSEGQVIKGFQHFIAKSIDATKGYYNWTIPEIGDYPNYKLRIYNKLCIGGDELLAECLKDRYFDESDSYFSIISLTVQEALSACEKISKTSDTDLKQRCIAMVKKDPSGCEVLKDPETYCYKDVAMVTQDSTICEKIKDSGQRGACEALAERIPAKCSEWIYGDYCWAEIAALTEDASICNLINYSGGRTDCQAVVLKDVSLCQNSDSEDCYQMLALLTEDEKVCEGLKERDDLARARDLDYEVNKCIKMAKREITDCSEVSGTGIDCDMIPVVAKKPSWCAELKINKDRCYFYTALRIADLLPLELILLRN